jgi:hypothetical protein
MIDKINKINFSKNWNNKLFADLFTTIRKHNEYYKEGQDYMIFLEGKPYYSACLQNKFTASLTAIPKTIIMIDTGYTYDKALEIFRRMHKKKTIQDVLNMTFDLLVFKKNK